MGPSWRAMWSRRATPIWRPPAIQHSNYISRRYTVAMATMHDPSALQNVIPSASGMPGIHRESPGFQDMPSNECTDMSWLHRWCHGDPPWVQNPLSCRTSVDPFRTHGGTILPSDLSDLGGSRDAGSVLLVEVRVQQLYACTYVHVHSLRILGQCRAWDSL